MTDEEAAHPIREKDYTKGRSYDTATGVLSMLSEDDITINRGHFDGTIPVFPTVDGITGEPLVAILEMKTPTSPLEPLAGICDVISICEASREGGGAFMMSPLAPPGAFNPAPRTSPSTSRVVRWLAWKQA